MRVIFKFMGQECILDDTEGVTCQNELDRAHLEIMMSLVPQDRSRAYVAAQKLKDEGLIEGFDAVESDEIY